MEIFDCARLDSVAPILWPDGKLHLWQTFTTDWLSRIEALQNLLSSNEIDRVGRFHFEQDKLRYIVAHGLLRKLIGRYLHLSPHRIKFRAGPFGKPELDGNHGSVRLFFNISHAHNLTVFAFSSYSHIGIDVEHVRTMPDFEAIVNGHFHPEEKAALQDCLPHDRQRAFFQCWTRKEAFIKATGEGLYRPLDSFAVPMQIGNRCTRLYLKDGAAMNRCWLFLELQPAPGYTGAVVVGR